MTDVEEDPQLRNNPSDEDEEATAEDTETIGEEWWQDEFLPEIRKGPPVSAKRILQLHLMAGCWCEASARGKFEGRAEWCLYA